MTKHDDYVNELVELIDPDYLTVLKNVFYGTSTKYLGEIDVVGIRLNSLDLYEVKSVRSPSKMRKAIQQLTRSREYLVKHGTESIERLTLPPDCLVHQGNGFIYTPKNGIESLEDIITEFGTGQHLNKYPRKIQS